MTYNIRVLSIFHFLIVFFGLLIGIGYTVSKFVKIEEPVLVFSLTILLFIALYKLAIKLTSGRALITLSKKEIDFKWVKKPLFRFQQNIKLNYDDIDGWKFRHEYQYDYFKIYSTKPSIGFERFPEWHPDKDDFYKFMGAFNQRIKQINTKRKRQSKRDEIISKSTEKTKQQLIIDKEEQFQNSYWPKVLIIIYIALIVLGVHYIYNNYADPDSNILMVLFGISGCLYLTLKTLRKLKSKAKI